jgi:hypothetical protein
VRQPPRSEVHGAILIKPGLVTITIADTRHHNTRSGCSVAALQSESDPDANASPNTDAHTDSVGTTLGRDTARITAGANCVDIWARQ